MAIFHQELGQVCTTMYLQGSAADNTVCKMHANDTVAACAAGNDFIGVVVGKRDGLACVQVAGFVTLPQKSRHKQLRRNSIKIIQKIGITRYM